MHLLSATPGTISDGEEAIDLDQPPGDIVILTVADSDLACFAAAAARLPDDAPSVRLANLLQLKHPYSVDLYVEKVIAKARFVCVILLGGKSYWPYGVDEIAQVARERGIAFAAIADGREGDPALDRASTVPAAMREQLRDYLRQGGTANALSFLRCAARLIGADAGEPDHPLPIADAGLYLPGHDRPGVAELRATWVEGRPVALLIFYRALVVAGTLSAVDAMVAALGARGFNVAAVHVRALREPFVRDWLGGLLADIAPDIIVNATSFAASSSSEPRVPGILEQADCPILQTAFAGVEEGSWRGSARGLGPRDLAMNVALPEVDGRLFTRAVAFKAAERFDARTQCGIIVPRVAPDRVAFVADLARNWAALRRTAPAERRVALVLANYPNRDGRIGNGVGLDTPASAAAILRKLGEAGYAIGDAPRDGAALMRLMTGGVTNDRASIDRPGEVSLSLDAYRAALAALPDSARDAMVDRWGAPEADPFVRDGAFCLAVHRFGHVAIAVQPARGYNIDPKSSYHDPALPPPHAYLAFHVWLAQDFGAQALVHVGKHGNLEWLPGKAVSLSADCFPEICAGPVPQLYPFIVNDPGEGSQAKRRAQAVILDHLTPPLTRAGTYGPLRELEGLVDEYYEASSLDPRRLPLLRTRILELCRDGGLDRDLGLVEGEDENRALTRIDSWLCELKDLQIRDGLHVFGASPEGDLRDSLVAAIARSPRGDGTGGGAALGQALAADLGLGDDLYEADPAAPWTGPRPAELAGDDPWRSHGDTRERLEDLGLALIAGSRDAPEAWQRTGAVLAEVESRIAPAVAACGGRERQALLAALDGRFVPPGPSGAPSRGRPDVLPTGRNFYSVDTRAVPTPAAWALGWKSAGLVIDRYVQDHGDWPRAMALSCWGTANMRTGGDDIAQALALIGARPTWDARSHRVTGFEILPLSLLDRPRVDVTLRVSGFFRDAFPTQMDLFDSAVRAIAALEEPAGENPIAARVAEEAAELEARGEEPETARARAAHRVFGSMPGAYGAGLQALIDEGVWTRREELAAAYREWSGFAYGGGLSGEARHEAFARRLAKVEAVLHNQDNREHDLLDSDDYYQFEGGLSAAVEAASGRAPSVYHNDHSRPEAPRVRRLEEEIARVVRGRVLNPTWIEGVMRHGYKGAFELAATVDYLFAFAATTDAVGDHHFDLVHDAYLDDPRVRAFMARHNPAALRELAGRLLEAQDRGLWRPRRNSARGLLEELAAAPAPQEESIT